MLVKEHLQDTLFLGNAFLWKLLLGEVWEVLQTSNRRVSSYAWD